MGYYLYNNKCYKKQDECNSYVDNVGCTSCKYGYYLSENECFKKKDECNEYIENVGCNSCKFGYTLLQNTCIKNPEKCSVVKKILVVLFVVLDIISKIMNVTEYKIY